MKYTGLVYAHAICIAIYVYMCFVRVYRLSSRPRRTELMPHSRFFFIFFFHVNKWYIFSAYSTYGFTVHFSLDLNNYKWTFSTLKNGTNVSHALFLSFFLSLHTHAHTHTHTFISLPISLSFSRLSFSRALFLALTYFVSRMCLTNAYILGCMSSLR